MQPQRLRMVLCCVLVAWSVLLHSQTAVVSRNVYLRADPSTQNQPITKLLPGDTVQLIEPSDISGFFHVRTSTNETGYIWSRNVHIEASGPVTSAPVPAGTPAPLLTKLHPVDWWFVFKFNSASFAGCASNEVRSCRFGGTARSYPSFSQQYVVASSEVPVLKQGNHCLGDTADDPVGATFGEVYDGTLNYVIWNDQFYSDPSIQGCGDSCSAPWGHSKGVLAWNNSGDGLVMQVTTPSWPASGSSAHPRQSDGNTLGCVTDNDVQVSQHFFALRLTKSDVMKVLTALANASVVTDTSKLQIVHNGGPQDIQNLVLHLGTRSNSTNATQDVLSTGVQLISKPSKLHVPPWQLVSALLGGVSLRTATWWATPKIDSTSTTTTVSCWDTSLPTPGPVEIATTGQWNNTSFGLTGGPGKNFNHAKLGVSISGSKHLAIFGDMNQQGAISGNKCDRSQNGRGGLFFVIEDEQLAGSVGDLLKGDSAPSN
jgi:hypothetical protein